MNLKPMDENTLAFLKDLVSQHEITLSVIDDKSSAHINGWHAAEYSILGFAINRFVENENRIFGMREFMEAIKNA